MFHTVVFFTWLKISIFNWQCSGNSLLIKIINCLKNKGNLNLLFFKLLNSAKNYYEIGWKSFSIVIRYQVNGQGYCTSKGILLIKFYKRTKKLDFLCLDLMKSVEKTQCGRKDGQFFPFYCFTFFQTLRNPPSFASNTEET